MNKSFSKIRHIQEANQRLEKRLISEQGNTQNPTPQQPNQSQASHPSKYKAVPELKKPTTQTAPNYKSVSGGLTYSVQKVPSGKFKIFVVTPTIKTPTDASEVFGSETKWIEYNTEEDARKAIENLVPPRERRVNSMWSKKPYYGD